MRNRRLLLLLAVAAAVAVLVALRPGADAGEPAGERLTPNLWTSAPFELQLSEVDGRTVLRFTSELNNRGTGDLLIRGNPTTGEIVQWLPFTESGHAVHPIDLDVVWGGDTHDHWHVAEVARYWIADTEGRPVGGEFDNKVGFCIFDSVDFATGLPGAPTSVRHQSAGCGTRLSHAIAMGLSVGWGDQYRFNLEGQYIDIEELPAGHYRIVAEVDPGRRLVELHRTDNSSWTEFTLEFENGRRIISTG